MSDKNNEAPIADESVDDFEAEVEIPLAEEETDIEIHESKEETLRRKKIRRMLERRLERKRLKEELDDFIDLDIEEDSEDSLEDKEDE